MSMASRTKRAVLLTAALAIGVATAIAAALLSNRLPWLNEALAWSWLPATVLVLLLICVAAGTTFALPRPAHVSSDSALPEPVVPKPSVPQCRRRPAIISLHGLEAQAGSTSIAFNLAVEVASAGLVDGRRPRPICVLRGGPLTSTVGLDPGPFTDYCRSRLATVGEDVIDLTERHPSGCEVLCIADGVLDGHRLRLLVSTLRQFYDLILIDCPPGDRWLTDSAFDASEVSLLIGLSTPESARAAVPWSDISWQYGLDSRFALVVNRASAATRTPSLLSAAFANVALIPEDVSAANALELPWVLRPESRAGRAITEIARRLVPNLAAKDESHAA